MTTFFGIAALGLLMAILWSLWRLVRSPLPLEMQQALERKEQERMVRLEGFTTSISELQRTVTALQSQLGGDSAFQSDLKRALRGLEDASAELSRLKGEREADLRTFTSQLGDLKGKLESIHTTLTGRRSGLAGENILREALRFFPAEWIRSPYYDVEFGVVLFDRRIIPIDSKFTATELLEKLGELEDDGEKSSLADEIERRVLSRAREVSKYINPTATTTFAICAVPNSIHDLLKRAHIQSYREHRVMIMSYSMAVPFLLLMYDQSLKSMGQLDETRLEAFFASVEQSVRILQDNLENRVKEANTRLGNAYRDCVDAVSKIEGALVALKSSRVQSLAATGDAGGESPPVAGLVASGSGRETR